MGELCLTAIYEIAMDHPYMLLYIQYRIHRREANLAVHVYLRKNKLIYLVVRRLSLLSKNHKLLPELDHVLESWVHLRYQILELFGHLFILV